MPMYFHKAAVSFLGTFPTDMLRYDSCYPTDSESCTIIVHSNYEKPRTVNLGTRSTSKAAPWTTGRWNSFGCKITPLESRKVS